MCLLLQNRNVANVSQIEKQTTELRNVYIFLILIKFNILKHFNQKIDDLTKLVQDMLDYCQRSECVCLVYYL